MCLCADFHAGSSKEYLIFLFYKIFNILVNPNKLMCCVKGSIILWTCQSLKVIFGFSDMWGEGYTASKYHIYSASEEDEVVGETYVCSVQFEKY